MAHHPHWTMSQVTELFNKPFLDLLFEAQQIHRQHFDPNRVQVSTLLSIKTGACPEDCKYCPQSGHYNTGLDKQKLMEVQKVLEAAAEAKAIGSTRFCMGAAWRSPKERDMAQIVAMVEGVKALGMETCATLGMLSADQARDLREAGPARRRRHLPFDDDGGRGAGGQHLGVHDGRPHQRRRLRRLDETDQPRQPRRQLLALRRAPRTALPGGHLPGARHTDLPQAHPAAGRQGTDDVAVQRRQQRARRGHHRPSPAHQVRHPAHQAGPGAPQPGHGVQAVYTCDPARTGALIGGGVGAAGGALTAPRYR